MTIPIILPTTPVTEANEDDLLQIQSPEIVRSILEANFATQKQQPMPTQLVTPQPGFVIKTRAIQVGETQIRKGEKVFINVGGEVGIPGAPDISDQELQELIESDSMESSYKIPLSLYKEIITTTDKQGNKAYVCDICAHTDVIQRAAENIRFRSFLIEICLGFVDCRFGLELSREYTVPNMLRKGPSVEHVVNRPKGPGISTHNAANEVPVTTSEPKSSASDEFELRAVKKCPKYDIEKEDGYFIVTIRLPETRNMQSSRLEIIPSAVCYSDASYNVEITSDILDAAGGAQFDKGTRILTPVKKIAVVLGVCICMKASVGVRAIRRCGGRLEQEPSFRRSRFRPDHVWLLFGARMLRGCSRNMDRMNGYTTIHTELGEQISELLYRSGPIV